MRAGAVLRGAGSSVAAPQIRFSRSDCRSASPASHERGGATAGGGGVALRHAATCVLKSPCGYRTLPVHFRHERFSMAIPNEVREDGEKQGNGSGGAMCARILGGETLRFSCNVSCPSHACCLPQERQTGTACEMSRSYSAHVGIAISAFSNPRAVIELCRFTSGMSVSLWRSRRSTKGRRDAGNRVGGAV